MRKSRSPIDGLDSKLRDPTIRGELNLKTQLKKFTTKNKQRDSYKKLE
jgi:hypothetical protein